MSFLSADWSKLVMAHYEVEEGILEGLIPPGTVPDLWKGRCYIGLIGFLFLDTRIKGIKIPFHSRFEEVNLRFYVRRGDKRGLVFVKEIVPKYAVSFIARVIYGEPYVTHPMRHCLEVRDRQQTVGYRWKFQDKWHRMRVLAERQAVPIGTGSREEFFTEHFWGYRKINSRQTAEYEVTHPAWKHFPILDYDVKVDFKSVYGSRFAPLDTLEPSSVLLAEGSTVTVENQKIIEIPRMGK